MITKKQKYRNKKKLQNYQESDSNGVSNTVIQCVALSLHRLRLYNSMCVYKYDDLYIWTYTHKYGENKIYQKRERTLALGTPLRPVIMSNCQTVQT